MWYGNSLLTYIRTLYKGGVGSSVTVCHLHGSGAVYLASHTIRCMLAVCLIFVCLS
jgi:hypothetical protein